MLMTWKSEKVYFDGDEYFESIFHDIDQAKELITIEMYIFNDDIIGKKLTAHLISAKSRGVKVQIIVDGIGSYSFYNKLFDIFKKKKISVKMYNPLPFYHPYFGSLSLGKKISVIINRLWKLNSRNHRKIITIDQNIMYVGSFNITAVHTKYHSEAPWKDLGVRVTGEYVKFAVLNFKKLWRIRDYYRFKKQNRKILSKNWRISPLRLNQTLFMKGFFYRDFLTRIKLSQQKIWLMTPYFIPKRRLIRVLGKAAKRGVDVRIIISMKSDVRFFQWLQYFYYDYLLKKGAKIYHFTDSVLHAKNYIIDDYITIGSTNLNHRSFIHDFEVDLQLQDDENKRMMEKHFLDLTIHQKQITHEILSKRPIWDRILSRFFFLLKYWS